MPIEEILNQGSPDLVIAALKEKSVNVPSWHGANGLEREYNPEKHPVMNRGIYPDIVEEDGSVRAVTRVPLDFQRLAASRMTSIVNGVPVKRVYKPENDKQKEIAMYMERIFRANYIDTVNQDRFTRLFAGCEVMTLWYAVEQKTLKYGFDSNLKIRCRTFSPMVGDELYPLFDEYGDMIAMSVGYRRKVGKRTIQFFDAYTDSRHIKWSTESGGWQEVQNENITLGKIPAVYMWRRAPIWERTSPIVYEIEWKYSRNGNYITENSKPLLAVCADEEIPYNREKAPNKEFRSVAQFPKGSTIQYVTWDQATAALEFQVKSLRALYFTQLQLPDWSYENMAQSSLSGEALKRLFIDGLLKGKDESDRLIEPLDREINVIKAFLKVMLPTSYANDIDALQVTNEFNPTLIFDNGEQVNLLMTANGGFPVMSQRESIERLGWSDDVDQTIKEIGEQSVGDALNPTM